MAVSRVSFSSWTDLADKLISTGICSAIVASSTLQRTLTLNVDSNYNAIRLTVNSGAMPYVIAITLGNWNGTTFTVGNVFTSIGSYNGTIISGDIFYNLAEKWFSFYYNVYYSSAYNGSHEFFYHAILSNGVEFAFTTLYITMSSSFWDNSNPGIFIFNNENRSAKLVIMNTPCRDSDGYFMQDIMVVDATTNLIQINLDGTPVTLKGIKNIFLNAAVASPQGITIPAQEFGVYSQKLFFTGFFIPLT